MFNPLAYPNLISSLTIKSRLLVLREPLSGFSKFWLVGGMKGVDTIARIRREFFIRKRPIKEIVRERA